MTETEGIHSSSAGDNSHTLMQRIMEVDQLELKTVEYTDRNTGFRIWNWPRQQFPYIYQQQLAVITLRSNTTRTLDLKENYQSSTSIARACMQISITLKNIYASLTTKHIAISETWITEDKGTDFELDGYDLRFTKRVNKGGGNLRCWQKQLIMSLNVWLLTSVKRHNKM